MVPSATLDEETLWPTASNVGLSAPSELALTVLDHGVVAPNRVDHGAPELGQQVHSALDQFVIR